jgi:membrane dipeptidase
MADIAHRVHGSPDARLLHALFPAIDLHADPLMWSRWTGYDLAKRHQPWSGTLSRARHTDLPRLIEGGVGGQFFGLVSLPVLGNGGCSAAIDRQIDILDAVCAARPDLVRKARTANDLAVARTEGTVAALLGIEGAHALEGKVERVAHFAARGVRYLGLAHFSANEACVPAKGRGADPDKGLTPFGREVVAACLDLGVIIDLAHINKRGFMEACAMARAAGRPVIVSHTGVIGAFRHWRNIDDEQLRAVADTGGVIGVIFAPAYLGGPSVGAVVDHMRHVLNAVGEDHVALGSDYDGMIVPPPELADVSMLPNLTDALLASGWDPERIGKTLRINALRVLNDAPPKGASP